MFRPDPDSIETGSGSQTLKVRGMKITYLDFKTHLKSIKNAYGTVLKSGLQIRKSDVLVGSGFFLLFEVDPGP